MIHKACLPLIVIARFVFNKEIIMFERKCTNGGRYHKYEARYNIEKIPTIKSIDGIWGYPIDNVTMIIEAASHVKKTYVHDICVWCGDIKK